jgi:hypothetical protein
LGSLFALDGAAPVNAMIDHTLKILNDGISSEPAEVRIPGKLIIPEFVSRQRGKVNTPVHTPSVLHCYEANAVVV